MNYEKYQSDTTEEQQTIQQKVQQKVHKQEVKNDKNVKNTVSSFELFWSAYPNKTGKKIAYSSWHKAKKDEKGPLPEISILLKILKEQKLSRKWKEGYIPNPSTWLNQGRWEDEVEKSTHEGEFYCEDHNHWIPKGKICGYAR